MSGKDEKCDEESLNLSDTLSGSEFEDDDEDEIELIEIAPLEKKRRIVLPTKDNKNSCSLCDFFCKNSVELKKHVLSHLNNQSETNKTQYDCGYEKCEFNSNTLKELRAHINAEHKARKEPATSRQPGNVKNDLAHEQNVKKERLATRVDTVDDESVVACDLIVKEEKIATLDDIADDEIVVTYDETVKDEKIATLDETEANENVVACDETVKGEEGAEIVDLPKKSVNENANFVGEAARVITADPKSDGSVDSRRSNKATKSDNGYIIDKDYENKTFHCSLCKFSCVGAFVMILHIKRHKSDEFICRACGFESESYGGLSVHVKTHGPMKLRSVPGPKSDNDKTFTCRLCNYETSDVACLVRHICSHSLPDMFTCEKCDLGFSAKRGMVRHILTMHEVLSHHKFQCEHCGLTFSKLTNLKIHKMRHMGQNPVACSVCSFKTNKAELLEAHCRLHLHQTFACQHCNFKAKTQRRLNSHLTQVHSSNPKFRLSGQASEKIYPCAHCSKVYTSTTYLKLHSVKHTNELILSCRQCGFKCALLKDLRVHCKEEHNFDGFACYMPQCEYNCKSIEAFMCHLMKHSGDAPYKCEYCPYRSSRYQSLKMHLAVHSKQKSFACGKCPRQFHTATRLNRHMMVHTGEKPFVCEHCGYRCAQNSNLKMHVKTHLTYPARKRKNKKGEPTVSSPLLVEDDGNNITVVESSDLDDQTEKKENCYDRLPRVKILKFEEATDEE